MVLLRTTLTNYGTVTVYFISFQTNNKANAIESIQENNTHIRIENEGLTLGACSIPMQNYLTNSINTNAAMLEDKRKAMNALIYSSEIKSGDLSKSSTASKPAPSDNSVLLGEKRLVKNSIEKKISECHALLAYFTVL